MAFQHYLIQLHIDLPTQNTTHIRSSYNACHNSNTNRINQEQEKANLYSNRGTIYPIHPPILSNNFFKVVEGSEYRKPISAIDSADAIVVLSGML